MFLLSIAAIVLISCIVLYGKRYARVVRHIDGQFPGPRAYPVFGNLLQLGFTPDAYLRTLLKWGEQYDYKNMRLWAGPLPYVLIMETKYLEHVLSSTTLAYKEDPYNLLYPWLGRGLLTSNDHQWAVRRKLITPSFHFRILKDFLHVINETTGRFMTLLEKESATAHKQMIDIQELVTRNTIDVICETAMGFRVNSIEGKPSPIVEAISILCNVIPERAFAVVKRIDFFFKMTPLYKQQQEALVTLREEFAKIIEQRRIFINSSSYQASLESNDDVFDSKRPKMAFLDNLLTAEVKGKPMSFQDIFEEVSTFMFEGHDTTASAITFAILCMALTPETQQKAYDEQLKIFGDDKTRHPTYNEVQEMKYLDLVIKETLRLFPSVPYIFRFIRNSTVILDKYFPKGTTIALPILSIGHSPHSFDAPFEFQPERFEVDNRSQASAFDNVPFSAGPRNCIGQKFALLELKVTLSKLLRKFQILPAPLSKQTIAQIFDSRYRPGPQEVKLQVAVTLKSMTGVLVRLQKRP